MQRIANWSAHLKWYGRGERSVIADTHDISGMLDRVQIYNVFPIDQEKFARKKKSLHIEINSV